ncbi:MAG: hypothetical protein JXA28_01225 [Bacteroidetes bacterium]|nr:hypothetical protein [Bacteroidota bacterium]
MRRVALPLSERFTVHAVGLLNKVHHAHQPHKKDAQLSTIRMARNMNFSLCQADEKTLQQRIGL